jgi:transcriptional regulator with XRE-family HTH domain
MIQRRDDKVLRWVAGRIRELRKERGLTQNAVIEDTGISMGRVEGGRMNLSLTSIAILCEYFEITLEEFFKGME